MVASADERLQKINQRLTRYQCQKARYLFRKGETSLQFRKARTRTLIQLGGLVEKAGLLDSLNITLGDDIQKDDQQLESAAILMGALSELRSSFYGEEAPAQKMIWRERGKEMLRQE
jgi:hypothetical protein